jgi:two-component system, LytTR family, response regulator
MIRVLQGPHRRELASLRDASAMDPWQSPGETRVAVKSGGRTQWVDVNEIDWIEASGDYVTLHVGSRLHMIHESMHRMERRLDPTRFARIHRSTIIALSRIQSLGLLPTRDALVTLRNGVELRVSRRFRHRISFDHIRKL